MLSTPFPARRLAMVPSRCRAIVLTAMQASLLLWSIPGASAGMGPTVNEVVEFTRILQPLAHDNDALQTQISPDGERAFLVTRRADVSADKNQFDILLLDVKARRLAARTAVAPNRVLRVEAKQDSNDADPPLQNVRWVGPGTLVFRARMHDRPFQVYRLEVATRRVVQLTFEPLGVVEFAVSRNLKRVVYIAPVPNPAMAVGARSLVVGNHSFWSVHFGQGNLTNQQRLYQWRVADAGSRGRVRSLGLPFIEGSDGWPAASISPDGRWAVLPRYEASRQIEWAGRYPSVAAVGATDGPSAQQDPSGYYSRPHSYVPRLHLAYRLADGEPQVVVDAPDDARPGGNQLRTDRLWQRGGRSVVIVGTHLPQTGSGTVPDFGAHIIEYWPDTNRWTDIAVLKNGRTNAMAVPGEKDAFIAMDGSERRRFERRPDGNWHEVSEAKDLAIRAGWRLQVEEALNQPPDIVATGPAGKTVRLTDLNPTFSASTWGTMRPYGWKDALGRAWEGGLMVPADFDPRARHSLVIQTYGFSPTRFYRDGSNIYDGFTSGFAGRAFLRENVLVLALPWRASSGAPSGEHDATAAFADGVRGAIDALAADGIVDRDRVGIMGWSGTGQYVLNLVTFSAAPIRAASLLDGDANTLFSMTITYGAKDGIQAGKERANEGSPYGESLARWTRNDPSLHTDCISAAMRIETYGPEVHNNWDVYALLRRQYRPAELVVIPRGSHALARPSERMISLQGNVDWYRFWLNNEQRSELVLAKETPATLNEQYARWRQMEGFKRVADAKPGCVRAVDGK